MTDVTSASAAQPDTYLSHRDEMSLADERAAQDTESVPDTLEVRSDSVAVLDGVVGRLRRPALVAAGIALAAAVVAVGLARVLRGPSAGPTAEA